MVSDSEVFQVHGQPPPVSVECMSQSELFYGIPSLRLALSMVYGICCMSVHCMTKPVVMRDLVASISSVPNCRSGRQQWLFEGPTVCLVTLTLLQPIVTQNMCFYGHNADLAHVVSLAVAKQLRMNFFDDLFVPTDMV